MKKHRAVIVVVSEGVKTAEGKFAAEEFQSGIKDVFGHSYLSGIGKFLEKLSEADTVIFDKTGTLTHACPAVKCVVPFNGQAEKEMTVNEDDPETV